jgi:hypothetical protein
MSHGQWEMPALPGRPPGPTATTTRCEPPPPTVVPLAQLGKHHLPVLAGHVDGALEEEEHTAGPLAIGEDDFTRLAHA